MVSLIFITIAAILSAIMDVIYHRWDKCIFSGDKFKKHHDWLHPEDSWDNKWKNNDPAQGEKFIGSSTVFVFLTDLWHFSKQLMIISIIFGMIFYVPIISWYIDFIFILFTYGIVFELFYGWFLIKK